MTTTDAELIRRSQRVPEAFGGAFDRHVAAVHAFAQRRIGHELAEGDYPEVLWKYADAVAGDGVVPGGKPITVEESYRSALCP